jgi:hypothetical protein
MVGGAVTGELEHVCSTVTLAFRALQTCVCVLARTFLLVTVPSRATLYDRPGKPLTYTDGYVVCTTQCVPLQFHHICTA